jgi:hypothetical protein
MASIRRGPLTDKALARACRRHRYGTWTRRQWIALPAPATKRSEHRLATGFHSPRKCEGGWRCDFAPAMPITVAGRGVENCGKFFRGISLRPCNIRVSWGASGRLRSDSTASTGSCPACGSFFIAPRTQIGPGTTLWRGPREPSRWSWQRCSRPPTPARHASTSPPQVAAKSE